MAYRRRAYRKRYNGRRKLTTTRILTNKSARAQSFQIAKLNRKVNYLTKVNRPEVLTLWRSFDRTFTNSALASNYEIGWYVHPWVATPTGKSYNDSLQGNFCRSLGFNFKAVVEYSDSWSGNITQSENHQRTATYRIVILQTKTTKYAGGTESSYFDEIFNVNSSLVSDDLNTTLPLRNGLTATYKVLFNKSYAISNERPNRIHNINLKKLLNFSRETAPDASTFGTQYPKGMVRVCILTGGLHYDSDFSSQIKIASTCKVAFTDN